MTAPFSSPSVRAGLVWSLFIVLSGGCESATLWSGGGGTPDFGAPDAGGPADADAPDGPSADMGTPDGGAPDATTPDAGAPDASTPDANTPDATLPDSSAPDGGGVGPLPASFGLASSPGLQSVAAFQAVQVMVVEDGAVATQNAPIIAGREVRFRVYVDGPSSGEVTALMTVTNGTTTHYFTDSKVITGASNDMNRSSLFEIDVPAEDITSDTRIKVALMVDGGSGPATAQFPRDGNDMALGARANGGLDVVVVPIRYGGDGSGRLPDTSDTAMIALREHIRALFPVAGINMTVREPSDYNQPVTRTGFSQWSSALNHVLSVRAADGAPNHEYYIGLINPGPTFSTYCGGGCVAGIAPLNTRNSASHRGGIALGYAAEGSRFSGIHEFGHAFGVQHAPCGGASGPDPAFPYSGGSIGVWGYDVRSDTFHPPSTRDMMGYCDPQWLSDYNFRKLYQRVVDVAGGAALTLPFEDTSSHHLIGLNAFTAPRWAGIVQEVPSLEGDEDVVMLEAKDAIGRPLGWVAARRVELSIPGTSNLLIPVVEGANHYEGHGGETYRVPDERL